MKEQSIVSVGHIELPETTDKEWIFDDEQLPVLPTRDFVMFPNVTFPIMLGRESSLSTARKAEKEQTVIGIFCQRNPDIENPTFPADIYPYGVIGKVLKIFELPDGNHTAILRSGARVIATGAGSREGTVTVEMIPESHEGIDLKELEAASDIVRSTALELFRKADGAPQELSVNLENIREPELTINMVATHTPFPPKTKIAMLSAPNLLERASLLISNLKEQQEFMG